MCPPIPSLLAWPLYCPALPWQDQLKHLAGSERVPIEAKHLDSSNMFDPRFFIFLSNHGSHPWVHIYNRLIHYTRPTSQLLGFTHSGDAFKTDGDTDELSRKFFITSANDEFSQAKRRSSQVRGLAAPTAAYLALLSATCTPTAQAIKIAADSYFTALDKAQNDPETVHHFFWCAPSPPSPDPHPPSAVC